MSKGWGVCPGVFLFISYNNLSQCHTQNQLKVVQYWRHAIRTLCCKYWSDEYVLLLLCAVVLINITCGQTDKLISNANMFLFCFFPPLAFFFFFFYRHNSDGWKPACIWHRRWPGTFKSSSVVTAAINSEDLEESLVIKLNGNIWRDAIQQNHLYIL